MSTSLFSKYDRIVFLHLTVNKNKKEEDKKNFKNCFLTKKATDT